MPQAVPIKMMPVPTPFSVGAINTYLVEDDPLTLVDCGPNSGTALNALEGMLRDNGRRVEDLERIVVTHQHMDHIGLAEILADRSGADVICIDPLVEWLADFQQRMEAEDAFAVKVMLHHGIPEDITTALAAVTGRTRAWGNPVNDAHGVHHDEVLEFASRSWRVHHRPGHSPSDTTFHDEQSGELLAGDHLLGRISSNPVIHRPLNGDESVRPRALIDYIESMKKTAALDLNVVYAGHGEPITDHKSLIAERLRMHERRANKIETLLKGRELTAHEIATEIWGKIAITQAYLTVSEVVGHVDILVSEGRASEHDDGKVVRFSAA